ncbi:MAG TPA: LysE family translocator [Spirochaetota bacterium]|nr:LysE family translocator [Spirochaetota bacterium]HNU93134.1 LysE family translocator [Spirochaetota bacterium]HPV98234.1 LysE family translocator [Spirochaetota bacterium]
MIELNTLAMFVTASTALAFAPGPDNIFVLAQSITMGRAAGFVITLGLCTGLIVHTAVVALGIAAIFQTSALAFNILKYIGAAYLAYLAWKSFKARGGGIRTDGASMLPRWALYRRGIIMNVTNPKVSLFFLAFLPQFTDPRNGAIAPQVVLLGAVFMLVTLAVFGLISQLAGAIGRRLARSGRWETALNRTAGLVFASLALKLVLTGRE